MSVFFRIPPWVIFSLAYSFLATAQINIPFENQDQLFNSLKKCIFSFEEQTNIYPLTTGTSSSKVYKVCLEKENYVLRINDVNLTKKNHRELYHHFEASKKGVAPKIYSASKDFSIILMEYIPGETLKSKTAKQCNIIKIFAKNLQKVHNIPIYPFPQKSIFNRMKELYFSLKERNLSFLELDTAIDKLEELNEKHKQFMFEKVTIHGDLHQGNLILWDEKIFIIDWEKTGYEDPFYDLCSFALCHDFSQKEEEILLTYYLGRSPLYGEKMRYALNKHMSYCYFALDLLFAAYEVSEKGEFLLIDSSLSNEWSHYIEQFESDTNFSAKFLYDFGRCALNHFTNFSIGVCP